MWNVVLHRGIILIVDIECGFTMNNNMQVWSVTLHLYVIFHCVYGRL